MSKAKLEEAVELVAKYELFRHDGKFNERVAALIDEVRGVDAEPVAIYRGAIDCGEHGAFDLEMLKMIPRNAKLYTHPAPSQPAAPAQQTRVEPEGLDEWIDSLTSAFNGTCNRPLNLDDARSLVKAVLRRHSQLSWLFSSVAHEAAPVELPVVDDAIRAAQKVQS